MSSLGPTEIIIIALVVVVLFGSKKLPDAARSIGRSLRIFKAETKGLRSDDEATQTQAPTAAQAAAPAAPLPIEAPPSAAAPRPEPGAAQVGSTASANGAAPVDAKQR
jgi:sec-independent protein translocase protein TatA